MAIARIIHQTWKTIDISDEYLFCVNSIKVNNPGFDYRLWTDVDNRDFIRKQCGWFLPICDAYRHAIERADAVRYFILYTYGVIY